MPEGNAPPRPDAPVTPRHDPAAEAAVLAAVLLDAEGSSAVFARLAGILSGDGDFYDPRHAAVWRAFEALAVRGERVDAVTLAAELTAMRCLNAVGGPRYLDEITDAIPTLAHCEAHGRIVAAHALARRTQYAAEGVRSVALDPASTPDDLAAAAQRVVAAALSRADSAAIVDLGAAADAEIDRICEADVDPTVRPTGIPALDAALCGGLREGELAIPGGRPATGKSALASQIAESIARTTGLPVVLVSLEMPRGQVVQRLVAIRTGIDLGRIRARAFLSHAETNAYLNDADQLRRLPLKIIDDGRLTPSRLRALCLAVRARAPGGRLGAVIFDYLQRGRGDGRAESREQEVAEVARSLKSLALELACPVVAPAQFNRALEGREDAPPRMSDFRGSGEIEQEADILLAIHRPRKRPQARELWVLKQRNGPAGAKVPLDWEPESARFVPSPEPWEAGPPGDWPEGGDAP